MAMTGFNPDEVSNSIQGILDSYNELMEALSNQMQSQFVGGMADKWACNNAQTFFNQSFKPTIDNLINNSDTVFQSVVEAMNSAGQAWASDTNTSYSAKTFSKSSKLMDVSGIQENIGGVRGIDQSAATSVVNSLSTIEANAASALNRAVSAVQNCGFVGGSQAANLTSSLQSIKAKLNSAVNEITAQTKEAINQTVNQYSDTEGRISQAFAGN